MRRARIGVVAVLVVLLAGCGGGGGHPRRDAVNAYFVLVDSAEAPLLNRRIAVDNALRSFSMSTNAPAEVQALKQAQTQILAAERRVAAIDPPADARKIHADLLALLRLEASLTGDLVLTTSYTPQFKQALAPTGARGHCAREGDFAPPRAGARRRMRSPRTARRSSRSWRSSTG